MASQGGRPILFTCPPRTQEVRDHRPFLATSDLACLEPAACPQGGVFYGTGPGGVALSKMEIAAHGQKVVFTNHMKHPVQLGAEAGPPHWLRQLSSGPSELRTPRAAGLGSNAAPRGPLHSESYGPEARPSASTSGPQDRAAFPGVEGHARGFAVIKNKPRLAGCGHRQWF